MGARRARNGDRQRATGSATAGRPLSFLRFEQRATGAGTEKPVAATHASVGGKRRKDIMADQPNTVTQPEIGEDEQAPIITPDAQSEAKFTQTDLDRIVKERLERERAKTKEAQARLADYEKAKARLAELEQANMTEDERRQKQAAELEAKLAEAERKSAEVIATANKRLVLAAVLTAANEAGFVNPVDAFGLLEPESVSVSEDGEVQGAQDAVAALAKAKPYLLRTKTAPNINAAPIGGTTNNLPRLTPEQEAVARKQGLPLERYAQRLAERTATSRR